LINTSFVMSPAVVKVPGTSWVEPVLVWLSACQLGVGKSQFTSFSENCSRVCCAAKCKDQLCIKIMWIQHAHAVDLAGRYVQHNKACPV